MKKFSNILNESINIEEIEDYFLSINDALGNPIKKSIGKGDFIIHEFCWKLDIRMEQYNDVSKIDKISIFFNSIRELKTSQLRINDYDIDFKLSEYNLSVRLIPKSKSTGNYNFYINQDWRATNLSYLEIIRFFKDKGYSVIDIESSNDDYNESSSVTIYTNADTETNNEFAKLLNIELDEKLEDNAFRVSPRDSYINIYPVSEKTYISIVKQ